MAWYWILLSVILALIIIPPILIKIYFKSSTKRCKSKTCLAGKTVIITGANTGIGYEAALDIAMRGAKLILACRDKNRAEAARNKIVAETGNENVHIKLVDMASFRSVREFAKDINESEECIDILIHNAGAVMFDDAKSEDGHVLLMQVNYLSSFLLTHLLIDLLKKSVAARIVFVSSLSARIARHFDPEKIDQFPGGFQLYNHTKLCQILFTRELANRLINTGVYTINRLIPFNIFLATLYSPTITTYSLHPGAVNTDFPRTLPNWVQPIVKSIIKVLYLTPEEGAQTTIYTAVAKDIEKYSGEHFTACSKVSPYPTVVAGDEKKLWAKSIELIKMQPHEIRI